MPQQLRSVAIWIRTYLGLWFVIYAIAVAIFCVWLLPDSVTRLQTWLAAIGLVALIVPILNLRSDLAKLRKKPDIRIGVMPGLASRRKFGRLPRLEASATLAMGKTTGPWREFTLAIQNAGDTVLNAPVVRIWPVSTSDHFNFEMHVGTEFKLETDYTYVYYSSTGHFMAGDTIIFGAKMTGVSGQKYRFDIEVMGANIDGPIDGTIFVTLP